MFKGAIQVIINGQPVTQVRSETGVEWVPTAAAPTTLTFTQSLAGFDADTPVGAVVGTFTTDGDQPVKYRILTSQVPFAMSGPDLRFVGWPLAGDYSLDMLVTNGNGTFASTFTFSVVSGLITVPVAPLVGDFSVAAITSDPTHINARLLAYQADGGSAFTGADVSVDGGSTWVAMAGYALTTDYAVTVPADAAASVRVRMRNVAGAGAASPSQAITPWALAAPTFSVQPSVVTGSPAAGDVLTFDEGTAGPSATLTVEALILSGVDKTSEMVGLTWDSTGETAGTGSIQFRATNATGYVLSNVIPFTLASGLVAATAAAAEFSRDWSIFDSGAAIGLNTADVPLAGTTDAADGLGVDARVMAQVADIDVSMFANIAAHMTDLMAGDSLAVGPGYTDPDGMALTLVADWAAVTTGASFSGGVLTISAPVGIAEFLDMRALTKMIINTGSATFLNCWIERTVPITVEGGPSTLVDLYANASVDFIRCRIKGDPSGLGGNTLVWHRTGGTGRMRIVGCDISHYPTDGVQIAGGDVFVGNRIDPPTTAAGRSDTPHNDALVVWDGAGAVIAYNAIICDPAQRLHTTTHPATTTLNNIIRLYGDCGGAVVSGNVLINDPSNDSPGIGHDSGGAGLGATIAYNRMGIGMNGYFYSTMFCEWQSNTDFTTGSTIAAGANMTAVTSEAAPTLTDLSARYLHEIVAQDWAEIATASGGVWSGEVTVPRSLGYYYRADVRVAGSTGAISPMARRFAAGTVGIGFDQSPWHYVFGGASYTTAIPEVIMPNDVQFVMSNRDGATSYLKRVSKRTAATASGNLVNPASVSFANAWTKTNPGHKLAFGAAVLSGTSPIEWMTGSGRDWVDDKSISDMLQADGSKVAMAVNLGWIAWSASPNNSEVFAPIMTQKLEDGTPVNLGDTITTVSDSFTLTHSWTELFDMAYTKIALCGPAGRAVTASQVGYTDSNDTQYELMIDAWRAMTDGNPNFPEMLPHVLESFTCVRGYDVGGGVWTDSAHPSPQDPDGAMRLAVIGCETMMRTIGLTTWDVPAFTDAVYVDGSHAIFWADGMDLTTLRDARGGTSSYVRGWTKNGAAIPLTTEVQLEPDANGSGFDGVRITDPTIDYTTIFEYGRGRMPGFQNYNADHYAKFYMDLLVTNSGQKGVDFMPVRMRTAAALGNNLPGPASFTVANSGYFQDPVAIGSATSISASVTGAWSNIGATQYVFDLASATMQVQVLSGGGVRLYVGSTLVTTASAIAWGVITTIAASVTQNGANIDWMLDIGGTVATGTKTAATLGTGQKFSFLASVAGASKATGTFSPLLVWKDDLTFNPATTYKTIDGNAATVNADAWKKGGDAT